MKELHEFSLMMEGWMWAMCENEKRHGLSGPLTGLVNEGELTR
jgi:predicted short-subunit dehydrogenase-like oxidoreductase (DUF2520 family)